MNYKLYKKNQLTLTLYSSYPATVATQLAELRSNEDFVDVTLACGGKYLKAHQLVLAACSPYFMQMFKVRFFLVTNNYTDF